MSETLATADILIATQTPGLVTIKATGEKPTLGHEVRFQDTPIAVFPPQFRLILIEPTQPSADVITPFCAETSFPTEDIVRTVIVFDSAGRHEVTVDQAREESLPVGREAFNAGNQCPRRVKECFNARTKRPDPEMEGLDAGAERPSHIKGAIQRQSGATQLREGAVQPLPLILQPTKTPIHPLQHQRFPPQSATQQQT